MVAPLLSGFLSPGSTGGASSDTLESGSGESGNVISTGGAFSGDSTNPNLNLVRDTLNPARGNALAIGVFALGLTVVGFILYKGLK